jgi:hypothetical protein
VVPFSSANSGAPAGRALALRRPCRFFRRSRLGIGNRAAHPQPNSAFARSMRFLPAIFANIVVFASALGFGRLLRRLFPQTFTPMDRFAFTLLGGLGLLGTVLFCVGQFWFSRSAIVVILLLGVALVIAPAVRVFRNSGELLPNISHSQLVPVSVVVVILLVTAVAGIALPTGDMNHDSIAYHFLGPKVWLRDHVIRPVPDEILTAFPAIVESQYAALFSIGGQRAPGLFAVTSLTAILLISAGLAIRLGLSPPGVWWTLALIVTMPALYRGAYGGFLDVLFAVFVLAAARMAFDARTPGHYALFGLFCGFAMATKYTGFVSFFLLIFCSLAISLWTDHQDPGALAKHLGISFAIAAAVASPVYLRNWIFFGCPIYPPPHALLRVFTATSLLPSVLHELEKNVRETGVGMGFGIRNFLLLPFNLTYHTANFRGAGGIGLAPLALGPLGVLASRRNSLAKGLVLFAVLQTASWFVTAQVSRYLIPVYALAAVFGVLGWEYVAVTSSKFARTLSAFVVGCSVLYGLAMILPDRRDDLHAASSPSFETQRRLREIPFLESFDFLNHDPSVTEVLIPDPYVHAFYSDKTYLKPMGRWGEQTLPDAANLQKILLMLPRLHVTHVLDVAWPQGKFRLPDHPPGLTLIFQRSDQRVFQVN